MSFFDKFKKQGSAAFAPSTVLPAVMEALTEAGFSPVRESATLVKYAEGSVLSYFCYREDEPDFLMAQANFERGAFGTEEELLLLRACAKTNCLQKAGKAYIDEQGDLSFTVENFLPWGTPIGLLTLYMRKALASTIAFFHETLQGLAEEAQVGEGKCLPL